MPDRLPRRLALIELPAGEKLYRCHQARHSPIFFGRNISNRFDAPEGEFGVCYLSRSPIGAFAETFLRRARGQFIERDDLYHHAVTRVRLTKPVKLVQCFGAGLHRNGIDARISSSADYPDHRQFSRDCFEHQELPDGLIYRARFDDDQFSIGLYDRASASISPDSKPLRWLDAGTLLDEVLDLYQIGI